MSLILERFDDLTLPLIEATQDIGAIGTRVAYMNLPSGGVYDAYGDGVAPRGQYTLSARGEVHGTRAEILTQVDAIRAKRGRRGKLYARVDDDSIRWVWARLRNVQAQRSTPNVFRLPVDLSFDITSPVWYGDRHGEGWTFDSGEFFDTGLVFDEETGDVFTLDHTGPISGDITNAGTGSVDNVVLTITAGADAITAFSMLSTGPNGDDQAWLEYGGTIAAGESLIIDAGAQSVTNDGDDAYADFSFGIGHVLSGWFRLDPGITQISGSITSTTDATLSVTFSDGYE
jgi:hypothetical protein